MRAFVRGKLDQKKNQLNTTASLSLQHKFTEKGSKCVYIIVRAIWVEQSVFTTSSAPTVHRHWHYLDTG